MSISLVSSALSNVQASTQNYAQNISSGNLDVSNIVGMETNKNQFSALVKVLKTQDDMEKQILNIVTPDKVDVTV